LEAHHRLSLVGRFALCTHPVQGLHDAKAAAVEVAPLEREVLGRPQAAVQADEDGQLVLRVHQRRHERVGLVGRQERLLLSGTCGASTPSTVC